MNVNPYYPVHRGKDLSVKLFTEHAVEMMIGVWGGFYIEHGHVINAAKKLVNVVEGSGGLWAVAREPVKRIGSRYLPEGCWVYEEDGELGVARWDDVKKAVFPCRIVRVYNEGIGLESDGKYIENRGVEEWGQLC
jgi:hypothetical protein